MSREILMLVAVGATMAGCLGPVSVSLTSARSGQLPAHGQRLSVMVADERSETSPARLGIILSAPSRNLMLDSDEALATRLERELVSTLRARGLRAEHARTAGVDSDVTLAVRIVRFAADLRALTTMRFEGHSVVVAHAVARDAAGSGWTEVVDTRERTPLGTFERLDALRKRVDEFFQKAVADLAARVSAGLPAPGSGP
jgi:hypothetical protein